MILDLPKWWVFLKYDGFKSHVNVTEGLAIFAEDRIRFGKEEAATSAFNQAHDKFQAIQEKAQTRQILELTQYKVHGQITQWQLTMVISTAIKISTKVWADYFVAVNLHPHHGMTFPDWITNISPAVKTGEKAYFQNHEGSYYDAMPSLWKNMYVPALREVMFIIDRFFREAPPGKSPRTKENFMPLVRFSLLVKYPRSRYAILKQRIILM